MFRDADSFNQDISKWNVSQVTTMASMFYGSKAIIFNQDISKWDVSQVIDMEKMFHAAKAFNQDISTWVSLVLAFVLTSLIICVP